VNRGCGVDATAGDGGLVRLRGTLDPDAVLPGEDPASWDSTDVSRWLRVYSELLGLKAELVERLQAAVVSMTEEARREAGIDHDVMSRQAGKYRARLEFWRGRAADLKGVSESRALQRWRTDR
jgi:hypothetical protein